MSRFSLGFDKRSLLPPIAIVLVYNSRFFAAAFLLLGVYDPMSTG
jgi:hypothetical protein